MEANDSNDDHEFDTVGGGGHPGGDLTRPAAKLAIKENKLRSAVSGDGQDVSRAVDSNDGSRDGYCVDSCHSSDSDPFDEGEHGTTTRRRSGPANTQTQSSLKWELKIEKFKEIVSAMTSLRRVQI